jgi:hypothetical protein
MTKGDAYRAYYAANRERILEASRARRAQMAPPDGLAREKTREAAARRREKNTRAIFTALAETATGDLKTFYTTLAAAANLATLSQKQIDWLTSLTPAAPASS